MENMTNKFFYSTSESAFFCSFVHGNKIPRDAVEISQEYHAELLEGQANGKLIVAGGGGSPVLIDRPAPTPEEIAAAVSIARGAAYASESDPLYFKAQRGEATMDEWLAKVAEIKARIPDGVMPS